MALDIEFNPQPDEAEAGFPIDENTGQNGSVGQTLRINFDETSRFLSNLGKKPAQARFRAFPHKHTPKARKNKIGARKLPSGLDEKGIRRWVLEQRREGRRVYAVINEGGDTKDSISSCVAYWAEFDGISEEKQWARVRGSGMPEPSLVVRTHHGGSLHFYWLLVCPHEEPLVWQKEMERLAALLGSDPSVTDPSRVMALPGSIYVDGNQQPIGVSEIVLPAPGIEPVRYSRDEIVALFPEKVAVEEAGDLLAFSSNGTNGTGNGNKKASPERRNQQRLLDQLQRVPPRVPGTNTYHRYLRLLWSLVPHFGAEEAARLMASHSPAWAEVDDLLKKARETKVSDQVEGWAYQVMRDDFGVTDPPKQDPADAFSVVEDDSAPAGAKKPERLTHPEILKRLRAAAAALLEKKVRATERIPLLRALAGEYGFLMRDGELQRIVWDARRAARGDIGAVLPGEVLDLSPTRWLWEGMLLVECLNLIVGLPKAGKTSLLVAMVAAWHQGATEFLGMPLIGPCPPVLLVGVDMPQNDWGQMLKDFGLMGDDNRVGGPIVGLFHKGRPLTLDPEGIEVIASYAEKHPRLLVLSDSYAELTKGLGLEEKDADFAEPASDLMEALMPLKVTVMLIHHSGKEKAAHSAAEASRGNGALPAIASQLMNVVPATRGDSWADDPRRILSADGRGGPPVKLLAERTAGTWISHGSPAEVERAARLEREEEKLNDRQGDALMAVREKWVKERKYSTAKEVTKTLGVKGSDPTTSVWRNLCQLERKGLLQKKTATTPKGDQDRFWPAGEDPFGWEDEAPDGGGEEGVGRGGAAAADTLARGHTSGVSEVSAPSEAPLRQQSVEEVSEVSEEEGVARVPTPPTPLQFVRAREGEQAPSTHASPSATPWQAIARRLRRLDDDVAEPPYESPERLADIREERIPQHIREQRDADRLWERQHLGRPPGPESELALFHASAAPWLAAARKLRQQDPAITLRAIADHLDQLNTNPLPTWKEIKEALDGDG